LQVAQLLTKINVVIKLSIYQKYLKILCKVIFSNPSLEGLSLCECSIILA